MRFSLTGLSIVAIVLVALVLEAWAQDVTYSVVALTYGDSSVSVVVDDKVYPLSPVAENETLLHSGKAPAAKQYYYYARTKQNAVIEREAVTREPVQGQTVNEFYNRSKNVWPIRQLPKVYKDLDTIKRIKTELHRTGEIPTIHFQGNQAELDKMHTNIFDDIKVKTNVTYISLHQVLTFKNVKLKLSGRSTLVNPKLSYNANFDDRDNLFGYSHIKLRAMASDPSYIRENVVFNMIEAAGLPATHISYIRVFINNQPVGLFALIEPFKKSWVRNEFGNGDKGYQQGIMFQGAMSPYSRLDYGTYPDLSYLGENETAYKNAPYSIEVDPAVGKPTHKPLAGLTRFINKETPLSGKGVIPAWEKHFYVDCMLRNLALEVLLGLSDGYLVMTDNYHIYQEHPDSERFIWLPNDVDMSLGNTVARRSKLWSGNYNNYPGFDSRPLSEKIVRIPELKERFEFYVKDMAERLLNPDVSFPFIDDTVAMITEDVGWDRSLPRMNKFDVSSLSLSKRLSLTFQDDYTPADDHYNFLQVFFALPSTMDLFTVIDFQLRHTDSVSFEKAINGHTHHISLAGVKEFINKQAHNTMEYFKDRNDLTYQILHLLD